MKTRHKSKTLLPWIISDDVAELPKSKRRYSNRTHQSLTGILECSRESFQNDNDYRFGGKFAAFRGLLASGSSIKKFLETKQSFARPARWSEHQLRRQSASGLCGPENIIHAIKKAIFAINIFFKNLKKHHCFRYFLGLPSILINNLCS